MHNNYHPDRLFPKGYLMSLKKTENKRINN